MHADSLANVGMVPSRVQNSGRGNLRTDNMWDPLQPIVARRRFSDLGEST